MDVAAAPETFAAISEACYRFLLSGHFLAALGHQFLLWLSGGRGRGMSHLPGQPFVPPLSSLRRRRLQGLAGYSASKESLLLQGRREEKALNLCSFKCTKIHVYIYIFFTTVKRTVAVETCAGDIAVLHSGLFACVFV